MKKALVLSSCLMGLMLSACSTSQAAEANNQGGNGNRNNGGQMMRQNQQDLQPYLTDANAAPDKTELTKEQFTAEMQTLMQAQMAKLPQNGSGAMMRRPYGSGAMMRNGSGSMMGRFGSGAMHQDQNGRMPQDQLATATTFLKYTDSNDQEVLLAVDGNGKVLMKWPRAFPTRGTRPPPAQTGGQ